MMASAFIAVASVFQTLEHYLSVVKNGIENLRIQHADLEEKIDRNLINEEDAREEVGRLQEQVAALNLHEKKTLQQARERAKKVVGLMMRAGFRREKDEHAKFQPCKDDLDFLKEMDPALCRRLRTGSLQDFCRILHPDNCRGVSGGEIIIDDDLDTASGGLERKDSIFHLHGNSVAEDYKEFQDQTERANALALEIRSVWCDRNFKLLPVQVRLLDGHGRMLVCLIKAVMDLGLDPDKVLRVTVFEIDEEVHNYHCYVFPRCVKKRKETVIDIGNDPSMDVIYLNFCSVTSGADFDAWVSHFENQNIQNWVPHCCKENVLRYIWKVIHPPYCCTVMISLVIKDQQGGSYHIPFRKELGRSITGFGFLHLLRRGDLFNADFVSQRPDNRIIWEGTSQREPNAMNGGGFGQAFVTLLVKPRENSDGFGKLKDQFDEWQIADLKEDTIQAGACVRIMKGEHKGETACIEKRRGVAQLQMVGGYHVKLSSCLPVDIGSAFSSPPGTPPGICSDTPPLSPLSSPPGTPPGICSDTPPWSPFSSPTGTP